MLQRLKLYFSEACLELLIMLAGKREWGGWSFQVTGMTQDFNKAPKWEAEREWKTSCDLKKWVKSDRKQVGVKCLQAPDLSSPGAWALGSAFMESSPHGFCPPKQHPAHPLWTPNSPCAPMSILAAGLAPSRTVQACEEEG